MASELLREQLAEMSLKSDEARAKEKATQDAMHSRVAGAEARAQGVEAEAAASAAKAAAAEAAEAEARAQRDEAGLKVVKLQAQLDDLEGSAALELTVTMPHCTAALVGQHDVCIARRAWGRSMGRACSPGSCTAAAASMHTCNPRVRACHPAKQAREGSMTLPNYHPYQARVATEVQSATGAAEALLAEREARVTGREARLAQSMEDQERQARAAVMKEGREAAHALHMHCICTACSLHIHGIYTAGARCSRAGGAGGGGCKT